jgi:hypothetical protein
MDKKQIWNSGYWILVILLLVLAQNTLLGFSQVQSVHYSDFENAIAQRLIPEVMVSDRIITGQFKVPDGGKTMLAAALIEPRVAARLNKLNVPYRGQSRARLWASCGPGSYLRESFSGSGFLCFDASQTSKVSADSCRLAKTAPKSMCRKTRR